MNFPAKGVIEALEPTQRRQKLGELANQYAEQHNCRWSEACLMVKRKYGDLAAEVFGAPRSNYSSLPLRT